MNLATISTLFEFGDWANEQIFAQVAQLTDEAFATTPLAGLPSVRRTLVHALGAETLWLSRFRTGSSALTALDRSPGDLDFLFYVMQGGRAATSA